MGYQCLHLNGKSARLKFVKIVQKDEFVPFLLALMPEACATTKLGKDFWLNVFRRGLQKSRYCLKIGRIIRDFCLTQGQGLSVPAAPPYPNIRREPPSPGVVWLRSNHKC